MMHCAGKFYLEVVSLVLPVSAENVSFSSVGAEEASGLNISQSCSRRGHKELTSRIQGTDGGDREGRVPVNISHNQGFVAV